MTYKTEKYKSTRPNKRLPRERVERAARIYNSNRDAGIALGIAPGTFGRLCRFYGIPTPQERRKAHLK